MEETLNQHVKMIQNSKEHMEQQQQQEHQHEMMAYFYWRGTTRTNNSESKASLGEEPLSEVTCIFTAFQYLCIVNKTKICKTKNPQKICKT